MNDRIDDIPSGEHSAFSTLSPPLLARESTTPGADDGDRLPLEPGWTRALASVQLDGETRVLEGETRVLEGETRVEDEFAPAQDLAENSSDIVVRLTPAGRRYRAILDTDGRAVYLIESWRNAQSEMESRQALELSEPEARALATDYEAALQATLDKPAFLSRLSRELRTP